MRFEAVPPAWARLPLCPARMGCDPVPLAGARPLHCPARLLGPLRDRASSPTCEPATPA